MTTHEEADLPGYTIFWIPQGATTPWGRVLRAETTTSLPTCSLEHKEDGADGGLQARVTPFSLLAGILLTDQHPVGFGVNSPTEKQYGLALEQLGSELGHRPADDACAIAAGSINQYFGRAVSCRALRRAVELIPDSVLCRGDLITGLVLQSCGRDQDAIQLLAEAAAVFEEWQRRNTTASLNRPAAFYCGMAAQTFIGRPDDREQIALRHAAYFASSPFLQNELVRLRTIPPGQLEPLILSTMHSLISRQP